MDAEITGETVTPNPFAKADADGGDAAAQIGLEFGRLTEQHEDLQDENERLKSHNRLLDRFNNALIVMLVISVLALVIK